MKESLAPRPLLPQPCSHLSRGSWVSSGEEKVSAPERRPPPFSLTVLCQNYSCNINTLLLVRPGSHRGKVYMGMESLGFEE